MFNMIFFYISLYLLLFIAWYGFKKDFLSPSVLMCASFVMGTTLYLMGIKRLEAPEFSGETVFLILSGIITFMCTEGFCKLVMQRIYHYSNRYQYCAFNNRKLTTIDISYFFYLGFILLAIVTAIIQFKHEKAYVGEGSFTQIVSLYRSDSLMRNARGNIFVKLFSRILRGIQPAILFVVFYNRFICKKKWKHPAIILILFLSYIISSYIISGSRGTVFLLFFQLLFAITICLNFGERPLKRHKSKGNKFWLKSIALLSMIGIPLFYYSGVLSGRKYSQISPLQSVINYFSYGMIRLNILITKQELVSSFNFGQWSFPGVYSALKKLGFGPFENYDYFPFYKNYGNTITIFGRWYVDFGMLGVIIMSIIIGIFYSYVYYRMKFTRMPKIASKYAMLYIFLMSAMLMASYDDWARNVLTLNGIFQLIVLQICHFYISKQLKKEVAK